MTNMTAMAREIEQSPRAAGGDKDVHNLSHVYSELASLQQRDGGPQSQAFQRDLGSLNQKLQADGVLPNLQITGIDDNNHILTKNAQTGEASSQSANNVYDFGQPRQAAAAPDSPLGAMAQAFGIPQNNDGRYSSPADNASASPLGMMAQVVGIPQGSDGNYSSPADNGQKAAGGLLQAIFKGMFTAGSDAPQQQDANGDSTQPALPDALGMNSWTRQAWGGWGDATPDDASQDS
jgi:hypothetical protein